jgi:hypothetical protein
VSTNQDERTLTRTPPSFQGLAAGDAWRSLLAALGNLARQDKQLMARKPCQAMALLPCQAKADQRNSEQRVVRAWHSRSILYSWHGIASSWSLVTVTVPGKYWAVLRVL